MANNARPDIPKKLAGRIRAAQAKLRSCIEATAWDDYDTSKLKEKLRCFEADPDGWAARNYPGHGKDSYPVQTHIQRARESLTRRLASRARHDRELQEAQNNLAQIEAEVLTKAQAMRPTSGRIPWPEPVPDLDTVRYNLKLFRREIAIAAEERRREIEAEFNREVAENATTSRQEDNQMIRDLVARGPEHVILSAFEGRAVAAAFEAYVRTDAYAIANKGNWSGGMVSFIDSQEARAAMQEGLRRGRIYVSAARIRGQDLWDVCRRMDLHTPDSVAALDRGEEVPLTLSKWNGSEGSSAKS